MGIVEGVKAKWKAMMAMKEIKQNFEKIKWSENGRPREAWYHKLDELYDKMQTYYLGTTKNSMFYRLWEYVHKKMGLESEELPKKNSPKQ